MGLLFTDFLPFFVFLPSFVRISTFSVDPIIEQLGGTIHIPGAVVTVGIDAILCQHRTKLQVAVTKPLLAFLAGCMVFLAIGVHLLDDGMDALFVRSGSIIVSFTNHI